MGRRVLAMIHFGKLCDSWGQSVFAGVDNSISVQLQDSIVYRVEQNSSTDLFFLMGKREESCFSQTYNVNNAT